ncbi:hypothetical protein M427DRAFT_51282 [Gonapodya prolifera JEL478]|uniref:Protein kinase domain-containing protein n=1 Tax=Gonapodya prolifera (strain JEL478) TaxID=1344416 RepID=A0A139AYS5_GONPJ|nr:hypothetical protein M427DRAFT_51282 [Gonapodya prolifera JEL478]|eukprot:KXS21912.1 hypothetical protein M427DRAFT_51282 [Gonapodya prolifera JEL478]
MWLFASSYSSVNVFSLLDLCAAAGVHYGERYASGPELLLTDLKMELRTKGMERRLTLFQESVVGTEANIAGDLYDDTRLVHLKSGLLLKARHVLPPQLVQGVVEVEDALGEGGYNLAWAARVKFADGQEREAVLRFSKFTRPEPSFPGQVNKSAFMYLPFDQEVFAEVLEVVNPRCGATPTAETTSERDTIPLMFAQPGEVSILREAQVLAKLDGASDFFVQMYGYYEVLDSISVMEGYPRRRSLLVLENLRADGYGTLAECLENGTIGNTRAARINTCFAMGSCVIALHDRGVTNGDPTLENQYVSRNERQPIKMFDFSSAQLLCGPKNLVALPRHQYRPPLLVFGQEQDRFLENSESVDIWVLGVNMYKSLVPQNDNLYPIMEARMNATAADPDLDRRVQHRLTKADLNNFDFKYKPTGFLGNFLRKSSEWIQGNAQGLGSGRARNFSRQDGT